MIRRFHFTSILQKITQKRFFFQYNQRSIVKFMIVVVELKLSRQQAIHSIWRYSVTVSSAWFLPLPRRLWDKTPPYSTMIKFHMPHKAVLRYLFLLSGAQYHKFESHMLREERENIIGDLFAVSFSGKPFKFVCLVSTFTAFKRIIQSTPLNLD